MTNHLQITLLGYFAVLRNGQPVNEFAADSARALLAYLALHPDRLHTREHLADLLWPEQTREVNLANLRSTLRRLREALNDSEDESALLCITRQSIGFKSTVTLWVDCQEIQRLAAAIRSHQHYHVERCPHCAAQMQQLVGLYTGNFLAGVRSNSNEFDIWRRGYQELLYDTLQEMLATLTAFYLQRHDFGAAIATARQQLAQEPWNEGAHSQLMRVLLGNGQRSAALAQYKRCCAVLEAEFGAQPTAATQALYAAIRANTRGQLPALPGLHTLPSRTALYGRQAELAWLCERLVAPNSRLVTLVGMGGVGKTQLAVAAAHRLRGCFADGVWFVTLAGAAATNPDTAAEAIASAIAEQLALPLVSGVTRRAQLLTTLAPQALLLVLDGFEALLAGRHLLTELLRAAPQVSILVTTRIHLALGYENSYSVPGLSYPGPQALAATMEPSAINDQADDALALFTAAAQRVQPTFALAEQRTQVMHICQLTLGLPLALEVAAAYVGRLPLATIAERIAHNLALLSPVMDEEPTLPRNLRAVFDHSWQLLPPTAQSLFVQLAGVEGSIPVRIARGLAGALVEQLEVLVRHSFLQFDRSEAHYELHPLLRQYGLEKLATPEAETMVAQGGQGAYFYLGDIGRLHTSQLYEK